MKIYHYHPEYKYYFGSSDADESPLEPGVFLIPAYATDIEPSECNLDEVQVFDGNSWNNVKDYSGIYYEIPSGNQIENLNPAAPPDNATKEKPPEVLDGYYLKWNDKWELQKIPSSSDLTPEEKLQKSGLTVEELKQLLGL